MKFNKEDFKNDVLDRLENDYGRNIESATQEEIYYSVSRAALSGIWSQWSERNKDFYKKR